MDHNILTMVGLAVYSLVMVISFRWHFLARCAASQPQPQKDDQT